MRGGITRRAVLCGGLTVLAGGGGLPSAAATPRGHPAGAPPWERLLLVWLAGGPSHLETFDPKPEAPAEVRALLGAVDTPVPGLQISEGLPRLARLASRLVVVRSLTASHATHAGATAAALTSLLPESAAPGGSEAQGWLPPLSRDLESEPRGTRERYGDHLFGERCLLARRAVESGEAVTAVRLGGWDTHAAAFPVLSGELLPALDAALSALLTDLADRGLLASTLVVAVGEFGRTPRLNEAGGRDHHPQAFSALLAGGGITGGCVVGATDRTGAEVTSGAVPVERLGELARRLAGRGAAL